MPLFSIIIPNYNHESFLAERIESVLHQKFQDFELLIFDDNSTDKSRDIIETYKAHPKISSIIYNEKNSGSPFLQWKKGIELAKGDWIWIAESDDLADPNFLEEAVETIQNNHSIGCYYTDSFIIDENGQQLEKASVIKNVFFDTNKWASSYHNNGIAELNDCLKFLCTINNTSALVFRKEIFTAIQEHLSQYRYYGDWFFFISALLKSDIYYNNKCLSSYRNHSANYVASTGKIIEPKKEYYKLLQFLLSKNEITNKKEVIRFFCLHYLGTGWIKEGLGATTILFKSYFKMNRNLAVKIVPRLIWNKLTGRKNKKRYP